MRSTLRLVSASTFALVAALLGPLPAAAKDPAKTATPAPAPAAADDGAVCGRDLMSADELAEHRAKMRSLATPEERAAYHAQHHAQMVARAKERGVTLDPSQCPRGGMGMGPGGGMGPGRGMGPPTAPPTPPKP